MTIKHKMQQYSQWKATYANKLAELQAIERDCILPRGIRYDKDKIMASHYDDGMLKLIEQMDKRIEQLAWLREQMQQFEDMVDRVEKADYKRLLHLYYIEEVRPLSEVAKRMEYSLDYINHMHGEALTEIGKILKDNNK